MALVALGLTACLPPPSGTPVSIVTTPGLFPGFQTDITNYVTRCDPSTPLEVHVSAPGDTYVSVDGGYPRGGIYGVYVPVREGESFTIAVSTDLSTDAVTRYHVRCLPQDFAQWSAQPSSSGAAQYVMTAPVNALAATRTAIYDRHGVPLWWSDPQFTIYSTLLPNGNVGTMLGGGVEERRLDGTFVRQVDAAGPPDGHDMLLLPNGHFVLVTLQPKTGVDLTAVGGPASASICDHVVQEIDPSSGSVVWSWDTADHIAVSEMDPQWYGQYVDSGPSSSTCGYDVYHWNSIERTSTGFLLSYRHLDALYSIDQSSGSILWKLGGSARPESLSVVGDPVFSGGSHFGGQHDARVLSDGSVTLYDDGSNLGRGPRGVRYTIDTNARTATLVESSTDPQITSAYCCGSARRVASGDWVFGFGGTYTRTGIAAEVVDGAEQLSVTFPGAITYRAIPLTSSQVSVAQLDRAMDTRFANPTASADAAGSPDSMPFPP
jgi:hypothetical protein